jgi:hypothetical protein
MYKQLNIIIYYYSHNNLTYLTDIYIRIGVLDLVFADRSPWESEVVSPSVSISLLWPLDR